MVAMTMTTSIYEQIGRRIIELLSEAEFKLPPGTIRQINGGRYVLKNSRWHRIDPAPPTAAAKSATKAAKSSDDLEALRRSLQRKIDQLEPERATDYEALLDKVDAKYWKLRDREDAILEAVEMEKNPQYTVNRTGQSIEIKSNAVNFGDFERAPQTINISPVDGRWKLAFSEDRYTILNAKPGEPATMISAEAGETMVDKLPNLGTQSQIDKFLQKHAPKPLKESRWVNG
jgi:hypothetical protein